MDPGSNGRWTSKLASAVNQGRCEGERTLPGRGAVRADSGGYAVAGRCASANLLVMFSSALYRGPDLQEER